MNDILQRIQELLAKKGVKASAMLREVDIKQSTYYTWVQQDRPPATEYIVPIAKYFGVTTDYLLGAEEASSDDGYYVDPQTKEIANELKENPGQRVLFDASKDLSPEDMLVVLDFISQQNKKEGRED